MLNGFKIIMGVVELNRILGIDLGVHDIEDVYDVCKSAANDRTYYLRVKTQHKGFVGDLEDSNKYAGDDRVFVTGNWEIGANEPVSTRGYRVPRHYGSPPSNFRALAISFSY